MAKRKRQVTAVSEVTSESIPTKKSKATDKEVVKQEDESTPPRDIGPATAETIQIVAGSYDRVLHGFTVSIGAAGVVGTGKTSNVVEFADTFLFNAHASAIRCVAVSAPSVAVPGQTQKVFLASGSTDERVQVYNISAHPASRRNQKMTANVAPRPILENSKNRELGTLLHHESTITALRFPTRSKLLSSSDDSTIAVTRTRDWAALSTVKAPKPKALGRPSGDTAAFGGAPSGVNDFAIHPSMKLMISVSKGERCMRLWNLVTGKKAGVLSFSKGTLQELGESRYSTGEARRVVWGSVDGADEFAVGFDRGIVVFGMDSVPKCKVVSSSDSKNNVKIHQFNYVTLDEAAGSSLIAVAMEDGRIVFFSTRADDIAPQQHEAAATTTDESKAEGRKEEDSLPAAKFVGQIGGKRDGVSGRIKDFVVLPSSASPDLLYVVGASSDGKVRVWMVQIKDLQNACSKTAAATTTTTPATTSSAEESIGKLVGTYETHNRITCMTGFLMIPRPEGAEDSEDEEDEEGDDDDKDDSESDDE